MTMSRSPHGGRPALRVRAPRLEVAVACIFHRKNCTSLPLRHVVGLRCSEVPTTSCAIPGCPGVGVTGLRGADRRLSTTSANNRGPIRRRLPNREAVPLLMWRSNPLLTKVGTASSGNRHPTWEARRRPARGNRHPMQERATASANHHPTWEVKRRKEPATTAQHWQPPPNADAARTPFGPDALRD